MMVIKTFWVPENIDQSSRLSLSGTPARTSFARSTVRYMVIPLPNSSKCCSQFASFRVSVELGVGFGNKNRVIRGGCGLQLLKSAKISLSK
jgi:hypothetical protein